MFLFALIQFRSWGARSPNLKRMQTKVPARLRLVTSPAMSPRAASTSQIFSPNGSNAKCEGLVCDGTYPATKSQAGAGKRKRTSGNGYVFLPPGSAPTVLDRETQFHPGWTSVPNAPSAIRPGHRPQRSSPILTSAAGNLAARPEVRHDARRSLSRSGVSPSRWCSRPSLYGRSPVCLIRALLPLSPCCSLAQKGGYS